MRISNESENLLYFLLLSHIINDFSLVETYQEDKNHENYANHRDGYALYNRTCDDRWKYMFAHIARPFDVRIVSMNNKLKFQKAKYRVSWKSSPATGFIRLVIVGILKG